MSIERQLPIQDWLLDRYKQYDTDQVPGLSTAEMEKVPEQELEHIFRTSVNFDTGIYQYTDIYHQDDFSDYRNVSLEEGYAFFRSLSLQKQVAVLSMDPFPSANYGFGKFFLKLAQEYPPTAATALLIGLNNLRAPKEPTYIGDALVTSSVKSYFRDVPAETAAAILDELCRNHEQTLALALQEYLAWYHGPHEPAPEIKCPPNVSRWQCFAAGP